MKNIENSVEGESGIHYVFQEVFGQELKLMFFLKFLRVQVLPACNEREHLEFISILKNGFHPVQEFDGPPINH